ncbi:MAG: hypothetical protein ACK4UN_02580 [Limisphaerales bacterium]
MKLEAPEPNYMRIEYPLVAGAALSASGQFYTAAAIFVSWFALKRVRPSADWEILFVASGLIGWRIVPLLPWRQQPFSIESVGVIVLSFTLFCTHSKTWARILLAYCALGLGGLILGVAFGRFKLFHPSFVTALALCSLSTWLLLRWLSRQKDKAATTESNAAPHGAPAAAVNNPDAPSGPSAVS